MKNQQKKDLIKAIVAAKLIKQAPVWCVQP